MGNNHTIPEETVDEKPEAAPQSDFPATLQVENGGTGRYL